MVTSQLPSREDLPVESTWDMSALYADRDAWSAAVETVRGRLPELSELRGTLRNGAGQLLHALELQDELGEQIHRVIAYAALRKDLDNANAGAVADFDRAIGLTVEASETAAFFEPELLALPDAQVDRYLKDEPGLQRYTHALDNLLRMRPHVLSIEQEQLLAAAGEIMIAPTQIFTMLNDADMEHGEITGEDGETITVTKGNYLRLLESRSRVVREAAFKAMHDAYLAHRNTIAATHAASVKTEVFEAKVRSHESALAASLHANAIPTGVYDNLVDTVNRKLSSLHRYMAMRKRAMGLEQLETWDLYVPIVPEMKQTYSFEQGAEMVANSLAPLGEGYLAAMSSGLDSRWVDVFENKGKTSGAYSWGVYGVHPFILMNWSDSLDDVFTLGHELGHAMHSFFTSANQPYTYGRYTIFVAEVASTVNELLMIDALRKQTDDPLVQMSLINHALEQFRGTLYRQTMFAEFERWTHAQVEQGGALTPESLSEQYAELAQRYYGPDLNVGEHTAIEWARIPHFYRGFYVYQYATGLSAAAALSKQLLDEGPNAQARYLRFLASGSSQYSLDLLREAGVDMATPAPIEQALEVFDSLLDEMEQLMDAHPELLLQDESSPA